MIHIAPNKIDQTQETRETSAAKVLPKNFASEGLQGEVDAVSQLRMHLSQLEDLHGRLRFVMSDVSTVLKKKF